MFKALFKLVILLVILVAVGGFFLGWWGAGAPIPDAVSRPPGSARP